MGYEIDFLPVGEGEKSGDTIAFRCGNLFGQRREQFIMVIDGGTKESGEQLVNHIRKYYDTNGVDLVVSSHSDGDHASGLTVVVEEMNVGQLLMHRPWDHSPEIKRRFKDGRLTSDGLSEKMKRALEEAWELEKIANRKGIQIFEPFAGGYVQLPNGVLRVLGPTEDYYINLLADFRDMPEVNEAKSYLSAGFKAMYEGAVGVIAKVLESWGYETLVDPEDDATSAENNSSVILLVSVDGHDLLFTADAGVPALKRANAAAAALQISLPACRFQQVPHHGSKRNVGPTILNRIVGPKLSSKPLSTTKTVFVSAATDGRPKHPSKKVTNAYQRRGAKVIATQGSGKRYHHNAPDRASWVTAEPVPFYKEVEEE